MKDDFLLIGIDGGATKVSGWLVEYMSKKQTFRLTDNNVIRDYASMNGYIRNFTPVDIKKQLAEFESGTINLTKEEKQQGAVLMETCAVVIKELAKKYPDKKILVGIGMPGLKTESTRGIAVVANGPRMPHYAETVEKSVNDAGIQFVAPIAHLGSDADYCGIGENFAEGGGFIDIMNAYYLGGGTGAADALLLRGELVPLDQTKSWLAKTWEMKNDQDLSLERYASASGIQYIYSLKSGIPTGELNKNSVYPPQIAQKALAGDKSARQTFNDVATYLSKLFYERISTLYCGSLDVFDFVNPSRAQLIKEHPYREELLERIIIGQRLGDLMHSRTGMEVLTKPILFKLSELIKNCKCLPEKAKSHYLHGNMFKEEILFFSTLRESPALGAGIDAYLIWKNMKK